MLASCCLMGVEVRGQVQCLSTISINNYFVTLEPMQTRSETMMWSSPGLTVGISQATELE